MALCIPFASCMAFNIRFYTTDLYKYACRTEKKNINECQEKWLGLFLSCLLAALRRYTSDRLRGPIRLLTRGMIYGYITFFIIYLCYCYSLVNIWSEPFQSVVVNRKTRWYRKFVNKWYVSYSTDEWRSRSCPKLNPYLSEYIRAAIEKSRVSNFHATHIIQFITFTASKSRVFQFVFEWFIIFFCLIRPQFYRRRNIYPELRIQSQLIRAIFMNGNPKQSKLTSNFLIDFCSSLRNERRLSMPPNQLR